MSQDLRLYSLSLLIVLMLWTAPVHADYGEGTGCPVLAVPIQLNDGDIWHSGSDEDGDWKDLRDLHPVSGTNAYITSYENDYGNGIQDCGLSFGSGTYYDGGNHLWVLDDNLTCDFSDDNTGDFRAGKEY